MINQFNFVSNHEVRAQLEKNFENADSLLQKSEAWKHSAKILTHLSYEELQSLFEIIWQDNLPLTWNSAMYRGTSNCTSSIQELELSNYDELYNFSIENPSGFTEHVLQKLNIVFTHNPERLLSTDPLHPDWLNGASYNIVDSCFTAPPEKIAIVEGNENGELIGHSYQTLQNRVNQIAVGLSENGYKVGDPIVLFMPLSFDSVALYLGIIKAGLIVVSVPDSFSFEELEKRIRISKAKAVFTKDFQVYNGKKIPIYSKLENKTSLPTYVLGEFVNAENVFSIQKIYGNNASFESVKSTPYSTTNILFSSGTTKDPKAIPWNHLTPIKSAMDGYFHQDIHPEDVVTWTTGMGWMMAPWLIYASLINDSTMALFKGSPATPMFGKFVKKAKVSILGTIPSLVKTWIQSREMEKHDWNIRIWSSTGEPSAPADYLYLAFLSKFKAPVIEYCGGTEIGGGYITGSVLQHQALGHFSTPALGSQLCFRRDNSFISEGMGEVFLIPPSLGLSETLLNRDHFEEYFLDQPKGPKGVILRKHGDIHFLDNQSLNDQTYYSSGGRSDDTMNLGGVKISSVEIETIVNSHAQIIESAAIGIIPSTGGAEQLMICFVGEHTDELQQELQQLISKKLNPLFRIHTIIQGKTLPRTASNKLMRRVLKMKFQ